MKLEVVTPPSLWCWVDWDKNLGRKCCRSFPFYRAKSIENHCWRSLDNPTHQSKRVYVRIEDEMLFLSNSRKSKLNFDYGDFRTICSTACVLMGELQGNFLDARLDFIWAKWRSRTHRLHRHPDIFKWPSTKCPCMHLQILKINHPAEKKFKIKSTNGLNPINIRAHQPFNWLP